MRTVVENYMLLGLQVIRTGEILLLRGSRKRRIFYMEKKQTGKVMKRKNPYMILDVTPFRDTRLSWKAKGLMTYFLDKPDGWEFILEHIYKQSSDGRTSVNSGLKELKKYGYIVRVAFRKNNKIDHYDFLVYEQPVAYPTEKDLHVDLEEWEKHLENGGSIDITLFAENRKPAKTRINTQVSENLKPAFQEPAKLVPGNKPLVINKDTNYLNNQTNNDCLIDEKTEQEATDFLNYAYKQKMNIQSAQATKKRYIEARAKGINHETLINGLKEAFKRHGKATSPISVVQVMIDNRIAAEEAATAAMAEAEEKERQRRENEDRARAAMIAAGINPQEVSF
jgi:hypothetical protein